MSPLRLYRRYSRVLALIVPLLALMLGIGVSALQLALVPAQAAGSVALPYMLTPLIAQSSLRGPVNPQQRISLAIGLRPRNQLALNGYLQNLSQPGSSGYHRFLSPAQYEQTFGPDQADYNALVQYLQAGGFTITHTYSHHLLIAFSGSVAQVERTFQVSINNYQAPDGSAFYANAQAPLLPVQLASAVQTISGLNDVVRWQHAALLSHRGPLPSTKPAAGACPTHGSGYYTSDQIAGAYNLQQLYSSGDHGEGQTIGLFELGAFSPSDLSAYSACFGGSHTRIQAVTAGSQPAALDSGAIEVEMDAELILGAAPGLSALKIYEAANNNADALAEWAQIVQDDVPVISTSWGLCEPQADPSMLQQENNLFQEAALQGQSIFAASGDSGSTGCYFDNSTQNTALAINDPASQPYVIGVGGTSLTLSGTASYGSESVWNTAQNAPTGGSSTGGISRYWPAPTWQNAPGVRNAYSSGAPCHAPASTICRETPDVSLNADPNQGYLVYCAEVQAGCDGGQPWQVIGGTSAAAPLWAAFAAIASELSQRQGGPTLGFIAPLLYQAARESNVYASGFHDVTTGNNDFTGANQGKYPATPGYDMATGLGSYNAYTLAINLAALALQNAGM
jgi:kumamolisin